MATEAAWLNRNRLMERRKRKCALTSTGLLMEGLSSITVNGGYVTLTFPRTGLYGLSGTSGLRSCSSQEGKMKCENDDFVRRRSREAAHLDPSV
jgi:hypothetical protein